MEGLYFDTTILIWVGACILFNIILWVTIKAVGRSILKKKLLNVDITAGLDKFNRIFSILRPINIGAWVIIIAILFIFHGTSRNVPHNDMGAVTTINEVKKFEPTTSEVIKIINDESLKEKENIIEKEVKQEQQKSSDDYEEFLKNSLEGVK